MTNNNLETYCLIWLDSNVNKTPENIQAQTILRSSINHLLTFEDDQKCLEYIDNLTDNDRVIFIVSGRFGQTIVPQIVLLRKIISIYIYCMNKQINQQWAKDYPKIQGVIDRLTELIQCIQSDQNQRQYHRIDEILSINIFKTQELSSTSLNGQFIYSHLLIDCLIRMNSSSFEQDKKQLIDLCKEQYKNNSNELQIIEEFDRNYSSKHAIWWYTRDCFLYRLLNKALRIQNIDLLYLMKFLIRDLGKQIEKCRYTEPICVYRAQQMSKEEIDILKNSIGEFISINSFFSTSLNRQQAKSFHYLTDQHHTDGIEQVFFQINADPRLDHMKSFSKINTLSYFPGEEEVLFMIGSIFRLDNIQYDHDGIWNIQMTLCSNNDHQIEKLFQYMKNELGTGETNILIFGHLLRKMRKFDLAEKYYRLFLNQLSTDDANIAHCYHALGLLADDKDDYQTSLDWYNKSLEVFQRTLKSNDENLAITYNSIAIVYQRKGDYNRALESYEKALTIWKYIFGDDHPRVAICLNNIGNVYRNEKKYTKALEYVEKALTILQKYLPSNHADLASSYGSIGNIHLCLGHHNQALESYKLALKISQKSLPLQHPDIAMTLNNIGNVYEDKEDYRQALSYFEQSANIYRHALSPTHPNVIQIEQNIKRISSKLT